MSLSEQVVPYIAAALGTYGKDVLIGNEAPDTAPTLGRRLLQEIIGNQEAAPRLTDAMEALIADPEGTGPRAALEGQVEQSLYDNPQLIAAVSETLTRFLLREIEAGNVASMVELGDLRRWQEEYAGARAAYQRAIDCGRTHALIDLARMLRGDLGDADGARDCLEQAIASEDADVAAEALVSLGHLLARPQGDYEGARAYFEQAISSRHPEWAPAAMVGLALLLERQGDVGAAGHVYQLAIQSGNDNWAARASIFLGKMLQKRGDDAGARVAYRRVVDSGNARWAPSALTDLVNLLRDRDDLEEARAVYCQAVSTKNTEAPYALVVIGQILEKRGNTEGARVAFGEAIEAGYEYRSEC